MNNFCADGLKDAQCVTFTAIEYPSEEQIFDILLDVLKSELPTRLSQVKDCEDNYMYISEEDIDLIPSGKASRFAALLNPLGQVPVYDESRVFRTVTHEFELILTAANELARCVTWELLRFKNVVEGLIVGAEFAIDGYNSVEVEVRGFNYYPPGKNDNIFYRHGSYRFAVTVTQYQIN